MASEHQLTALPNELLDHITSFIPDKAVLSRLSQTCQRLYFAATPPLYRNIDLVRSQWKDGLRHLEAITALALRNPNLAGSVRYLGIHDDRSNYVGAPRSFDAGEDPADDGFHPLLADAIRDATKYMPAQSRSESNPDSANETPSEDVDVVMADAGDSEWESGSEDEGWSTTSSENEAGFAMHSDPDKIIRSVARNGPLREAVLLAILIKNLPKLQALDLELPDSTSLWILDLMLGWHKSSSAPGVPDSAVSTVSPEVPSAPPLRPFDSLTSVCFGCARSPIRIGLWLGLFDLPSLTHLYLHRVTAHIDSSYDEFIDVRDPKVRNFASRRSLPLKHLELRDCRIEPDILRRILGAPRALRTFTYIIGELWDAHEDREPYFDIPYRTVRRALEQQKDSLEDLWIDYPHDYWFDDEEGGDDSTGPMGSFAPFKKVWRLRIATTYLFGWVMHMDAARLPDSLPEANLTHLHLTHADEDEEIIDGLKLLLKAKRNEGRFPRLTRLTIETCITWLSGEIDNGPSRGDRMLLLVEKAGALGIQVQMVHNYADTMIESYRAREAAERLRRWDWPRREDLWGAEGGHLWRPRMSGCNLRPAYPVLFAWPNSGLPPPLQVQLEEAFERYVPTNMTGSGAARRHWAAVCRRRIIAMLHWGDHMLGVFPDLGGLPWRNLPDRLSLTLETSLPFGLVGEFFQPLFDSVLHDALAVSDSNGNGLSALDSDEEDTHMQ